MRLVAIAAALGACTGVPDGVEPVPFDAGRYLGTWYEIARLDHRFERGLTDVTATYSADGDGIGVVNRGWNPDTCKWAVATGSARFLRGPGVASLAVRFDLPVEGGYHVFALDDGYQTAVVSGPTRDYLWLLARTPRVDEAVLSGMLAAAHAAGFDTEAVLLVPHGAPTCEE